MYLAVSTAILVTMVLALTRALRGPTVYDRILSVNMFGTKTVLLLSALTAQSGRSAFLDLALTYALINFIGVLAVLAFVQGHAEREAKRHAEAGRPDEKPAVTAPGGPGDA
jgi:multicomponent Na+:H+ antiporter subunit F